MKKVTTKLKQALSILLAAAMVITMVPQNALSVSAQEEAVETVSQAEDTVLETNEETTDGTVLDGAEVSEETGDTYVTEGTDTAEIEDGDADAPDEEDASDEEDAVVYGEDDAVVMDVVAQDITVKDVTASSNDITDGGLGTGFSVYTATYNDGLESVTAFASGTQSGTAADGYFYFAVKVNTGYALAAADAVTYTVTGNGAPQTLTPEGGKAVQLKDPTQDANYYYYYKIENSAITAATEIDIKVVEVWTVTLNFTKASGASVAVTASDDVAAATIASDATDNTITVPKNKSVTFTVKPGGSDEVKYVGTNSSADASTAQDDSVTVNAGNPTSYTFRPAADSSLYIVTGAAEAETTKYSVSVTGATEPNTGKGTGYEVFTATYSGEALSKVEGITASTQIDNSSVYYFAVKLDENYELADTTPVVATVNGNVTDANVATQVGSGTIKCTGDAETEYYLYQIPTDKITGDITIAVSVEETKEEEPATTQYTITFAGAGIDDVDISDLYIDDEGADVRVYNYDETSHTVKVDENSKLKFKVAVKSTVTGKKLDAVTPADGEALTADDDGFYTYDVTENKTINITTRAPKADLKLTFAKSEKVDIKEITQTGSTLGKSAVDGSQESDNDRQVTGVTEDKDLTFKVELKSDATAYKITSVKADGGEYSDKELTATAGVYTVNLTADTTITVETELDPTNEANASITFASISQNGIGDTFTAGIAGVEGTFGDTEDSNVYVVANASSVTGTKTVTITPKNAVKYFIGTIKLDGETLDSAWSTETNQSIKDNAKATIDVTTKAWSFDVNFTTKKQHTIEVGIAPEPVASDLTVSMINNAAHLTWAVESTSGVEAAGKAKYTVGKGASYFNFSVTAESADYTPVVKNIYDIEEDEEGTTLEAASSETTDKGTVYHYSMLATDIRTGSTDDGLLSFITIDEKAVQKTVKVAYYANEVDSITFYVNGEAYDGDVATGKIAYDETDEYEGESFTYQVVKNTQAISADPGSKVSVVILGYDGILFGEGVKTVGTTKEKIASTRENQRWVIDLTADDDTLLDVNGYWWVREYVTTAAGDELAASGKYGDEYNVPFDPSATYKVQLKSGPDAVKIGSYKAYLGTKDITEKIVTQSKDKKTLTVTIPAATELDVAGKTINFILNEEYDGYDDDYEYDEAEGTSFSIIVAKAATGVSIAGVKSGKVTQNIDTEKTYQITMTPKGAGNTLALDVDSDAAGKGISAVLEGDQIKVTVANTAVKDATATIKLYDKNDASKTAVTGGEFKVTVGDLLTGVKPTVALKSVTANTITLTLGSKVADETLESGELWYRITVTDKSNQASVQKFYQQRTGASDVTEALQVIEGEEGTGTAKDFTVSVELFQTKSGTLTKDNDTTNFVSSVKGDKEITASTKAPAVPTKLSAKKLNGGKIYTGQEDLEIAEISFDKNATYKSIAASVPEGSPLTVKISDDGEKVLASADTGATPGKYKVTVTSTYAGKANELNPASVTFDVTIVQGIEDISVSVPETVYKKDTKTKATVKPVITYNYNQTKPAAKKATWSLLDYENNPYTGSLLTINQNNGTVTIDKSYTPDPDTAKNVFYVVAKAADYNTSDVESNKAAFEVKSSAADIGAVIIVTGSADDGYEVLDVNKKISADVLNSAQAVALKAPATETYYTSAKLESLKSESEYTLSASNKAVTVDADGYLSVSKTARNVKITATSTDGSKVSQFVTLKEVGYADVDDLGINIEYDSKTVLDPEDKEPTSGEFYGPKDAQLTLTIEAKKDGKWSDLSDITDLKFTGAKGVKITASKTDSSKYTLNATGTRDIEFTLASKELNLSKTYKLTNKSIAAATVKTAAPKLSLLNKNQKLYSGYNGKYLLTDGAQAQTVTYTLSANDKETYADGNYFILITADVADSTNAKNAERYAKFLSAASADIGNGKIKQIGPDGTVTLTFNGTQESGSYYTNIPTGSYKLNYLIGKRDENGELEATTKAGNFTLKAEAQKTIKANLKNSYTMSLTAGAAVQLELNNKNAALDTDTALKLYNANINGKENTFTSFFTVNGTKLTLKKLTEDQLNEIADPKAKDNFTGWVAYTYKDTRGDVIGSGITQIKVTFQDQTAVSKKYSISADPVVGTSTKVTVKAYESKKAVGIAYAVVTSDGYSTPLTNADKTSNAIELTKASGNVADKDEVTLSIVPADSYYCAAIAEATGDEAKINLIKTNGISVTAKITVKDANSTTGKYKVDSKIAKQTFTADSYEIVEKEGYYKVTIPYTVTVNNAPAAVTASFDGANGDAELFTATVDTTLQMITVKLSKTALQEAVTARTAAYGKSRSVKVYLTSDGYANETISLTLTMPAEAKTYDKVKTDVQSVLDGLTTGKFNSTSDVAANKESNRKYVEDAVKAVIPKDGDTGYTVTVKDNTYTAPTTTGKGTITIAVALENLCAAESTIETKEKELTLNLAPSLVKDRLDTFINDTYKTTVSNESTAKDLLTKARAAVITEADTNIRLSLDSFNLKPATVNGTGEITATFTIKDIYEGTEITPAPYTMVISKLDGLDDTADKIWDEDGTDGALNKLTFTNKDIKDDTIAATKKKIQDAADKAITNKDIKLSWKQTGEGDNTKDDFNTTPADKTKDGEIKGTLVLTLGEATKEVSFTYTIDRLPYDNATVKAAIKNAVGIDESDNGIKATLDKLLVSNDYATVKDAILNAAKDAVSESGFTVAYKEDTSTVIDEKTHKDQIAYTFKAATWKEKGSITFTLAVTDTAATDKVTVDDITLNAYDIDKLPQTLQQAADAVKEALGTNGANISLTSHPTYAYTTAEIETATKTVIGTVGADGKPIANTNFDYEVTAQITKAQSFDSTTGDGTAKVTVKITDKTPAADETVAEDEDSSANTTTVVVEGIALEKLVQADVNEAARVVGTLDDPGTTIVIENTDGEGSAKTTKENEIKKAAEALVDGSKFTIEIKNNAGLTIDTPATVKAAGSATITLVVKLKTNTETTAESELTFTIAKLAQDFDAAQADVKAAVEGLKTITNTSAGDNLATTKEAILQAANGALDDAQWQAVLSETEGEAFEIKTEADVNNAGSATVTVIVKDANTVVDGTHSEGVKVACTIVIAALDQVSLDAAQTAAQEAVDKLTATVANQPSAQDILDTVNAAIKQSKYSAAWSTAEGEGYKSENGSITGKIILNNVPADETTKDVTVNIAISDYSAG